MKKLVILLSVLLGISLVGLGVSVAFLYNTIDESKSKTVIIKDKDGQIRKLKSEITSKDNELNKKKNLVSEKDKQIKDLNKKLKDKKALAKKAKEESNVVAEKGEYMSEDSGGDPNGSDPLSFLHRSVEVSNVSNKSITFHLWCITSHSADGGSINDITVSLKDGHGTFATDYQYGGNEDVFKGEIDIIDSKTIKVKCLNDVWGDEDTHLFTKK